jgi:hypothetical protein
MRAENPLTMSAEGGFGRSICLFDRLMDIPLPDFAKHFPAFTISRILVFD